MKAVILAGGLGTRISEESHSRPKPMIEVGGRPLLWHIMKIYSAHGVNDFVICCGYKGYVIKEYFANYFLHAADVTISLQTNSVEVHNHHAEPWRVTLVDTGETTMTGGRLRRVGDYLTDEHFYFTYGDGLSNVDISALGKFHAESGRLATVTAVLPPGRYGAVVKEGNVVEAFAEKPRGDGGLINGGFFVLNRDVISLIKDDTSSWEEDVLPQIVAMRQLSAFEHLGFWQAMDTQRDMRLLDDLWNSGHAPWKVWA